MPSSSSEAPLLTPRVAAALLARCASRAAAASLHARLLRCSRAFFRSPYLANCLAAAYSRLGAASSAVALLRHAPPTSKPNVFTHNILLSALLSSGLVEDARTVFDGMPQRDAVTYNSIITGYIEGARPDEAFQLVYTMREHGVSPTGFTFSIISLAVHSARHGLQLHAAAVRHGLAHRDAVVGNALINMHRRIGLMKYAVRVFACMQEPDVTSWNSVMSVYKDQSLSSMVFECLQSMRSNGVSVDECSVSTILSVCTDVEDFAKGDQILALCLKTSFLSNSIVCSTVIDFLCVSDRLSDAVRLFRGMAAWDSEPCNALISGYARSGLMEEALSLFATSLRNGVVPTEFTFSSVLRWSSCFGLMEQGTQIHCLVCKLGFGDDVIVATALTDMYCKLGLVKHARKMFNAVGAKDLVLWNTMLLGLLQNGRGKEALGIFRRMLKHGIRPDRITLLGALSACSLKGLVNEGMDIISLFKDKYDVMLSLEHHACVVDILSRAGMFRKAVNYAENRLHKCGASAFSKILEACIIEGNFHMAELIAEKMVTLKSVSSLPYIVLAQTYGARCKWEKMARVWRSMEDQCTIKVQPCSWLCIKNHIHVFTSDQLLHHGRGATYEVLDLLLWDILDHKYAPSYSETKKSEGLTCLQLFFDYTQ
ncbi:pentatricopeptide repeat-containing protein At1g43980, mitochondrial [Phragmites australis]|uniref:pentatricopeptide repeat-containing protein At1g43980, mitochondrial n=1 Tax=Phragmites australis TaxID=29695 RepID=UPI002D79DA0D|nr:pentatricopeptide repeat-containing protein At1g43980, mitochondrial [Phragmites australis]XP_062228850.1 pentatricopeptide repeat-containing protein At1g43980, mitochondrial [Phragmites australis]XP_062228851.1 pentatricopeptide repeat-containing protein At1g43980, mitochondrial [Phragmites australis]XP_062228852.1 pentatricopeptide repeat-containing protein At1g43980, mitochondrial [Phragmites australis]XP_062228853.1 pentatricopeptide repeat-containing protein At1g43980, mitochondrial [Ph